MTHARMQHQLSAYLDGELTPAEADEVRTHLVGCAACRETLSRLQHVKSLLQRLPERPVPEELWATIGPRIGTPATPPPAPLRPGVRAVFRRPALARPPAPQSRRWTPSSPRCWGRVRWWIMRGRRSSTPCGATAPKR